VIKEESYSGINLSLFFEDLIKKELCSIPLNANIDPK
jgi:hypothetical protein